MSEQWVARIVEVDEEGRVSLAEFGVKPGHSFTVGGVYASGEWSGGDISLHPVVFDKPERCRGEGCQRPVTRHLSAGGGLVIPLCDQHTFGQRQRRTLEEGQ